MTDETKSPAELLLNACVYAPIGLALEARNLLPTLAERGRNHVNLARVVGQFALGKLGKELGPLQNEAERWLAPILASLGLTACAPSSVRSWWWERAQAKTRAPAATPI